VKLTVETDPALTETEIIIHCAKQDKQLERLIRQIRQCAFVFHGKSERESRTMYAFFLTMQKKPKDS